MSILIRAFRPEDSSAVNRIAVAAYRQYQDVFADWRASAAVFAGTANLAAELDLLVAVGDGGDILGSVGYVAPGRRREALYEPDWALIRRLAVDPQTQRRGVGRQLTEECIARARQDGASVIALQTSPVMQAALMLYFDLGFAHCRGAPDIHGVPHAIYTLLLRERVL